MAQKGYLRLYGYRPNNVTAGFGPYAGSVCDNSAAEASYAAIVALHKQTLYLPFTFTML